MATKDHSQLKPFVKGDPRCNRKGRPKKADILSKMHEDGCNALIGIINGTTIIEDKCFDVTTGNIIVIPRKPNADEIIRATQELNKITKLA